MSPRPLQKCNKVQEWIVKRDVVPTTSLNIPTFSTYLQKGESRKTIAAMFRNAWQPSRSNTKRIHSYVFCACSMIKQIYANQARLRRHQRIRRRIIGSQARPRLNVFRSGHHIYAQIIDDTTGQTLVAASSLEATLRDFKPAASATPAAPKAESGGETPVEVEQAAEAAPTRGKGAKSEKAPKAPAKGGGKAPAAAKIVLPAAQKGEAKTPVEALAAIANNRKVALAREVGKLVASRAKEKGVSQVVFDRGGYAYHGRVAALAEGAREAGLSF